ncbi:hypothetical protein DL96DRAFT_1623231 [Flagelloscypha sp. PMI_526]|nr:hypothetical protein DL96DRAFT_1623231 [Flagelloscypha sp. PMI_526]
MSKLTNSNVNPVSPQQLPLELFEQIISFIDDHPTLKVLCLTCRNFLGSAQARLFSRLDLTVGYEADTIQEHIQSITSSPHLTQHTRHILTHYAHVGLPSLLEALPDPQDVTQRIQLRNMTFTSDPDHIAWTIPLLRALHTKVFPFLTSLTLDTIDAPLAVVTSCRALRHLTAYCSIFYIPEDTEYSALFSSDEEDDPRKQPGLLPPSPESQTMPSLTRLAIDGTQNPGWTLCPLITLVQRGRFPTLKYLNLVRVDRSWFPGRDIEKVLKPLMNQLTCLDAGSWHYWKGQLDPQSELDLFRICHYPNLRCFSIGLEYLRGSTRNLHQVNMCLEWLIGGIDSLTSPYPLEVLILPLAQDWTEDIIINGDVDLNHKTGGSFDTVKENWGRLDGALAENPHLVGFEKLIIPVLPEFVAMRQLLLQTLQRLGAAGKLSFVPIDIGTYLF